MTRRAGDGQIERSSIQTAALVDFRLVEEVLRETGRR